MVNGEGGVRAVCGGVFWLCKNGGGFMDGVGGSFELEAFSII